MVMWHLRHEHYPTPPPRERTPTRFAVKIHIQRAHARPPQIPPQIAPRRNPSVPMGRRLPGAQYQRATQCISQTPSTLKHCGSHRPTVWQGSTPLPYSDPCTGPEGIHSASTPPTQMGATPSRGAVAHAGNPTPQQPTSFFIHFSNAQTRTPPDHPANHTTHTQSRPTPSPKYDPAIETIGYHPPALHLA